MRRDWLATGIIVVIVASLAAWYLTTVSGCDPASGVCFQPSSWGMRSLLIVIGIGAVMIVYSVATTGVSRTQNAAEAPESKVSRRDEELEASETEAVTARKAVEAAQAESAAQPKPSRAWTETLSDLKTVLRATEEKIRFDQEEARARILNFAAAERPTLQSEEFAAGGAPMEESPPYLQLPEPLLTRQDRGTDLREEELSVQNERHDSTERWGQEAVRLTKELLRMVRDIHASRSGLLEVERELRYEFAGLTVEWNRFVANESSLLETLQRLIEVLGPSSSSPTARGARSVAGAPMQPSSPSSVPAHDQDTLPSSSSVPGVGKESMEGDLGPGVEAIRRVRVTESQALERMKTAARIARKAREDGRGMPEVSTILERALASFMAGAIADAFEHSERAIEILRGAQA